MAWRLAYSLEQLRTEVNQRWPQRSKASDGTIGDTSHAASASDHNPNGANVVCAFDITHDPIHGPDIEVLGRDLVARPHPDAKYVIFNRKIASRSKGWTIRVYTGADPHTNHVHVSVGVGPDGRSAQPYDDRVPWLSTAPPSPEADLPLNNDDVNKIRMVATAAAEDAARVMWGAPAGAAPGHFQMIVVDKIASVVVDRLKPLLPPPPGG